MTITDLGSMGEFVSAIAILVTLIYLTIQVRHTRRETAASLLQQRTVAVREMYLAIATSETLSDAMSKAEDAIADGPRTCNQDRRVPTTGTTEPIHVIDGRADLRTHR